MIPPTIKSNRRYIAFKVVAKPAFTPNQIIQAIKQAVLAFVGSEGYASAEFDVVEYDHKTMVGIVRATPEMIHYVVTALSLITKIQGKSAGVVVLGISGTVKKTKSKYLAGAPARENLFKGDETQ